MVKEPTFAEWFRNTRKSNLWSQSDLAKLLLVSPILVVQWEQGHRLPSPEVVPQLARYFRVDEDQLHALVARSKLDNNEPRLRVFLCHASEDKPQVFNSDQGVQFTSLDFTGHLLANDLRISMNGRGRALDNIFVERLRRSVKREEVYIRDYQNVGEAVNGLGRSFDFYNHRRLHQSLSYQTPAAVYWQE